MLPIIHCDCNESVFLPPASLLRGWRKLWQETFSKSENVEKVIEFPSFDFVALRRPEENKQSFSLVFLPHSISSSPTADVKGEIDLFAKLEKF